MRANEDKTVGHISLTLLKLETQFVVLYSCYPLFSYLVFSLSNPAVNFYAIFPASSFVVLQHKTISILRFLLSVTTRKEMRMVKAKYEEFFNILEIFKHFISISGTVKGHSQKANKSNVNNNISQVYKWKSLWELDDITLSFYIW